MCVANIQGNSHSDVDSNIPLRERRQHHLHDTVAVESGFNSVSRNDYRASAHVGFGTHFHVFNDDRKGT